jgi:rhamnosyltransferase
MSVAIRAGSPWVVLRCKDDAWVVAETLDAIREQTVPCRILCIDSGSQDGSLEILNRYADRLIQIAPETYIPGRVLNTSMRETDGGIVVFLNSDATPQGPGWLAALLGAFDEGESVAAAYGRQVPRHDATALVALDMDQACGETRRARSWHFISMASSAIRRTAWERRPFDEQIRYSEDVEWTWWAKREGYRTAYVPEAVAMHSHNYTATELYRRHFGEGDAEARIFDRHRLAETWPAMVVMSTLKAIARDLLQGIAGGRILRILGQALVSRPVEKLARYRGFWHGKKDKRWKRLR